MRWRRDQVWCCPTIADKGFVAQKALSAAFIPSRIFPHILSTRSDFSNRKASELERLLVLLESDAIMCAACTGPVNADIIYWLLLLIDYTMNNWISVCKSTNTLTMNIQIFGIFILALVPSGMYQHSNFTDWMAPFPVRVLHFWHYSLAGLMCWTNEVQWCESLSPAYGKSVHIVKSSQKLCVCLQTSSWYFACIMAPPLAFSRK